MSTTTSEMTPEGPETTEVHSHGPTDQEYFKIFWILVVLTALEVSTHWWGDWFGEMAEKVAIPLLIIMMVVKFFLVALYFMHLKFDAVMLKRIFYGGMILALILFTAALTMMNFWTEWGNPWFNDPGPQRPAPIEQVDTAGG